MAQQGADTSEEQESLKPVSFLLSHFENLAHEKRRSPTPEPPNTSTSSFLRAPTVPSRASLDLPRPDSEWSSSHTPKRSHHTSGRAAPKPPPQDEQSQSPGSPGRPRHTRPLSMFIPPTSPRNSSSAESPQSSPRNVTTPSMKANARQVITGPTISGAAPRSEGGVFRRTSQRPVTPLIDSSGVVETSHAECNLSRKTSKSSSVPPPVNRAEKPKIFTNKPAVGTAAETNVASLAPSSQRTSFEDNKVSPFSTPPSSPEKPSPPKLANGSGHSRSPSHLLDPGAARRPKVEPPPLQSPRKPKPPESRAPVFSRDTKPTFGVQRPTAQPQPPPPPAPIRRTSTLPRQYKLKDSAENFDPSDDPAKRPGLPPRLHVLDIKGSPQSGRKVSAEPASATSLRAPQFQHAEGQKRSLHVPGQAGVNVAFPPPPRRDTGKVSNEDGTLVPQQPRSQSRPAEMLSTSPGAVQRHMTKLAQEEATSQQQEPLRIEDAPVSRMDYPDASHSNRRPPLLKTGARAIHLKHDTRVYDVCGQYVCTTGFFTRAWNLVTGEQILSLSHGETLKGVSVAFKPGRTLDDEGKYIWIGTNTGELMEVDITTNAVVTSRFSPSRREIIKIYRHQKELWTLDDEGRLLLWPPDESGAPNLQYSYSNPYDRVAKGHTFSMVVGDVLWYATGKELRLYRPNMNDSNFQVLKTPLVKNHSGDITCGTSTTKEGGRVYLGHADGKVTIYSTTDFTCVGQINVSLYKISALAMVGDYIWAGYKTGMIYIYDTSTNPWTVKKDWLAHDNGVCGLIFDPSGIWTINRLQVVSLGVDSYIRIWDGMLEDDWLETRMQSRDVEYCRFREITAAVLTWNAGAAVPSNIRDNSFIRDAIHPECPPDFLVFGFQELVNLEDKKITAKSLLKSTKKKDHENMEHISRQYRVWRDYLASCVHEFMPLDEPYVLLHTANLIGLFTCVFVKQELRQKIRNVGAAEVKRGMGGLHGNKGALILRFILDDSSICLINCHLAAGQTQTAHRNNDIAAILESDSLPVEPSSSARIDHYVGGGDGSMILDHEICILNGDLNYRIDSIPRNTVIEAIRAHNLPKLLERDQLLASRRKNPAFRLRSFNEMPITFAPTYKYDVGTDNYDSSEKKRSPAWCDRLLYRGVGRIKQLEYRRHEVRVSDHRPVSGLFKMRVKTISPQKRNEVWESCRKEFGEESRRLATEASIDYLVRVVGVSSQEARSLISVKPQTCS
ncbi:hypothetical protein VTO42DRAFT_578 [Malbranchea cinnamomea]